MATPSSKPPCPCPMDPEEPIPPEDTSPLQGFEGWEDVTELCRLAASMLGPNEMIHDSDFSLYGAMSALELMDAKMDKPPPALESLDQRIETGALPTNLDTPAPAKLPPPSPPPPRPPIPPEAPAAAAAAGTDPRPPDDNASQGDQCGSRSSPFSPSQRTLSVLDGMAVCEVAWHEGGSLPETLYACLYLHPTVFSAVLGGLGWELPPVSASSAHPRLDLRIREGNFSWKPVDRALTLAVLAQSLATLRCCSLARDVIILADIFEEEDFYPSTFGFRLAPPVEDGSLMDLLSLAEEAMRERVERADPRRPSCGGGMEARKSSGSTGGGGSGGGGGSRSTPDECILAHLESRTQLLQACLALRDAFTNKQRLRRLRALEKRRAEELAKSGSGGGGGGGDRKSCGQMDGVADAATGAAAAAAARLEAGQDNGGVGPATSRGQQDAGEGGDEVAAAAEGVAAMSIDPSSAEELAVQGGAGAKGGVGGTVVGEKSSRCVAGGEYENNSGAGVERGGGATVAAATGTGGRAGGGENSSAADNGCNDVELVIEGRGMAAASGREGGQAESTTVAISAAPCAGGNLGRAEEGEGEEEDEKGQPHRSEGGCDDTETPLAGIWRCADHLRAAAIILKRLLAIDDSLGSLPPPPPPLLSAAAGASAEEEKRNRPLGKEGSRPGGVDAAAADAAIGEGKGAAEEKKMPPKPEAFTLGGRPGAFAFEAEMNRHLLGSSPQHHVHFRRGRAEGPRTLLLLAQEAERACGVVRCEDLLGVRRCLLRLFQPPATESKGGGAGVFVGTATLFARSVAAVCLYRQDMVLGRFDVMWFVAEAMIDIGVPDAVINSPSGMGFLERVGKPVYETLRTLCLNRARQRTSLELQMQDWRSLQAFANTVDDAFQLQYGLASSTQRYMSKWALTEVLGLMHRYLQIGVELQLPSAHEWASTYWYWDYVMTTKIMTEASLRESKEQLEAVKAQMEEERAVTKRAQEAAEAAEAVAAAERASGEVAALAHAAASASTAAAAAAAASPSGGGSAGGGGGKKSKKKKRGGNKAKKTGAPADAAGGPGVKQEAGAGAGAGAKAGASAEGGVAAGAHGEEPAAAPAAAGQKTAREMSWAARRDWETADMKLRQCLCRGAVRLIAGLESLGLMGQKAGEWPEFRFTSPEIVHRERFRAFQALDTPAFQPHQAFLEAVDFDAGEAVRVVDAAAECFRMARTLASDLLRRGDIAAKELERAAEAAGAVHADDDDLGGTGGSGGGRNEASEAAMAAVAAEAAASGGVVGALGGGWAVDRLELLAMAKLAVSNGVTAMQVIKRSSSAPGAGAAAAGARGGVTGKARLEFDSNRQFPVAKATFE